MKALWANRKPVGWFWVLYKEKQGQRSYSADQGGTWHKTIDSAFTRARYHGRLLPKPCDRIHLNGERREAQRLFDCIRPESHQLPRPGADDKR